MYMLLRAASCSLPPFLAPSQFHDASTTHIATVLSSDEHTILSARAAASPLFVLPLSKKPGQFQTLLLQWQPPSRLLFTTLEEFKQWGPQAPPHMTVQLYEDLKGRHGVVLARGDLINPQLINAAEVRAVMPALQCWPHPVGKPCCQGLSHGSQSTGDICCLSGSSQGAPWSLLTVFVSFMSEAAAVAMRVLWSCLPRLAGLQAVQDRLGRTAEPVKAPCQPQRHVQQQLQPQQRAWPRQHIGHTPSVKQWLLVMHKRLVLCAC
jgi:hypothetical protein